jgi:hypothetical protein
VSKWLNVSLQRITDLEVEVEVEAVGVPHPAEVAAEEVEVFGACDDDVLEGVVEEVAEGSGFEQKWGAGEIQRYTRLGRR